jgi:hypothetical protein
MESNFVCALQDGLTPLDLCLRLGHHVRTYEIIKLLKTFQGQKQHIPVPHVEERI